MSVTTETPRSVRNNNPTNIVAGDSWRGLLPFEEMSPSQRRERRFAVFSGPEWGFRAAAKILKRYDEAGINTVARIIARWAPPSENKTKAYIAAVAKALKVSPDQVLNLHARTTMAPLLKAIATHETGGWRPWWSDAQLARGLELAGF